MLKIYAVEIDAEYMAFYLRRSDADADAEDREQECVVVPIVIREEYPLVHKED